MQKIIGNFLGRLKWLCAKKEKKTFSKMDRSQGDLHLSSSLASQRINSKLAVVVAQLVERSLPIPEVHGLNPVISKIYIEHLFTVNCIEKTKINKNGPAMALFNKEILSLIIILEKYGINIVSEML